jgi:hypothetical protein
MQQRQQQDTLQANPGPHHAASGSVSTKPKLGRPPKWKDQVRQNPYLVMPSLVPRYRNSEVQIGHIDLWLFRALLENKLLTADEFDFRMEHVTPDGLIADGGLISTSIF